MYYEPGRTPHGLPHDPFKSCVVPRPIGWIATVDAHGRDNLAPHSQFQTVTFDPTIVMFSANKTPRGERKDSVNNADQRPYGVDEFVRASPEKFGSSKALSAGLEDSPDKPFKAKSR